MSLPAPVDRPRSPGRSIGSFAWALSPALSLGFLTPITFLIAAVRRRTVGNVAGFVGYSALWAFYIGAPLETLVGDIALGFFAFGAWLGGSVHALLVRKGLWFTDIATVPTAGPFGPLAAAAAPYPGASSPPPHPGAPTAAHAAGPMPSEPVGDVIAEAKRQRAAARQIAASDPMMAKRLHIGRPDLGRYEDGGLVDINHAPASVLAELPGLSARSAEQIRERVATAGSFQSIGELLLEVEMDALYLSQLEEYAVFIP